MGQLTIAHVVKKTIATNICVPLDIEAKDVDDEDDEDDEEEVNTEDEEEEPPEEDDEEEEKEEELLPSPMDDMSPQMSIAFASANQSSSLRGPIQ